MTVNAARFDAVKHDAQAVIGDARETLVELSAALGDSRFADPWVAAARAGQGTRGTRTSTACGAVAAPDGALTYAQVVGVVNDVSSPDDYVLTASGGMPGELHGGWRTGDVKPGPAATSGATMDLEYGFSCMGYEVVAPWGAAMARSAHAPRRAGDVPLRRRLLPDAQLRALLRRVLRPPLRRGRVRQRRLRGDPPAADQPGCRGVQQPARGRPGPAPTAACASTSLPTRRPSAPMSRTSPSGSSAADFREAYLRAREVAHDPAASGRRRLPHPVLTWTESGAWWETGVPEDLCGRAAYDEAKPRQLRWLLTGAG